MLVFLYTRLVLLECPGGVCPPLQGYQIKDHLADPLVRDFSCFKETDTVEPRYFEVPREMEKSSK